MNLLRQSLKKNLHEKVQSNPEACVYFFDESRFGTHSKHGLGWFKKGSRTKVSTKLGFRSFYLYSATHDKTGHSFSLILPHVNKTCMQIFMDEFALSVCGKIIIVMDQAGWHKDLKIPSNIEIIFLPPYSPELNPVERLWQHIKDAVLKNRVYDTLDALENKVVECLNSLSLETVKSVCRCSYV